MLRLYIVLLSKKIGCHDLLKYLYKNTFVKIKGFINNAISRYKYSRNKLDISDDAKNILIKLEFHHGRKRK